MDEPEQPHERTIGVAIAIPEPFGDELQRWREYFGDPLAAAIPSHVTLLPPTVVDAVNVDAIERYLRAIAEGELPFPLHLRGTATPAGVARGVRQRRRGHQRLRAAGEASAVGTVGSELRFNYHPHVTIAHDLPDELWTWRFAR